MKLEDLAKGQIIKLRWEFWDHDMDGFEPRVIHVLLLKRNDTPVFEPPNRARGWETKVIYDSNPRGGNNTEVPYDNIYYDTWLKMSIDENKLTILADPENEV